MIFWTFLWCGLFLAPSPANAQDGERCFLYKVSDENSPKCNIKGRTKDIFVTVINTGKPNVVRLLDQDNNCFLALRYNTNEKKGCGKDLSVDGDYVKLEINKTKDGQTDIHKKDTMISISRDIKGFCIKSAEKVYVAFDCPDNCYFIEGTEIQNIPRNGWLSLKSDLSFVEEQNGTKAYPVKLDLTNGVNGNKIHHVQNLINQTFTSWGTACKLAEENANMYYQDIYIVLLVFLVIVIILAVIAQVLYKYGHLMKAPLTDSPNDGYIDAKEVGRRFEMQQALARYQEDQINPGLQDHDYLYFDNTEAVDQRSEEQRPSTRDQEDEITVKEFQVTIGDEASQKLGVVGSVRLLVEVGFLTLISSKGIRIARWAFGEFRSFGFNETQFHFEAGRKSNHGEGHFNFTTAQGMEIVGLLKKRKAFFRGRMAKGCNATPLPRAGQICQEANDDFDMPPPEDDRLYEEVTGQTSQEINDDYEIPLPDGPIYEEVPPNS